MATITKISNTYEHVPAPSTGVHCARGKIVFDNSYPTGGEALDLQSDLGLPTSPTIKSAKAIITDGSASGFLTAEYNTSTEKVLLYDAAGAQVADTTDASTVTVEVSVEFTV